MTRTFRLFYQKFKLDLSAAVLHEVEFAAISLTNHQVHCIAQRIQLCTDAFRVMTASPQLYGEQLRVRREQQMCIAYLNGHIPSLAASIVNVPSHEDFLLILSSLKQQFYSWFIILYNN